MNALEIIKSDLAEFKTTMANDTSSLLMEGNSLLGGAVSFLKSADESSEDANDDTNKNNIVGSFSSTRTTIGTGSSTIQERYKQELVALQSNQSTFLDEPSASSKPDFAQWLSEFDAESHKTSISELLIENSSMRLLYAQLVPAQLSNDQFWSRYFYKVTQLDQENRKRIMLIERAAAAAELNANGMTDDATCKQSESLDWGDENGKKKKKKKKKNFFIFSFFFIIFCSKYRYFE
jgi:hypothetical protein